MQNVGLRYAGTVLFERLNFTLQGGQWTCILGLSGVGKSSLLRFIAGLIPVQHGRGTVQCSDSQPLPGRVAYMAQQDLLLPWLSVLQNVLLGRRLRNQSNSAAVQRAHDLLKAVGLSGHANNHPQVLSGGMRQRVALARTLMEDKPVNLLDEPFASLDALTRYRLQALAAELLTQRTTLLVTHDPLEALRLGHRVYVLAGSPAQFTSPPLEPAGQPPRALSDPGVLELHEQLLARLGLSV